jgi:hypothetical protein
MFSYIGICDFPSGEQSTKSVSLFEKLTTSTRMSDWKLMVGVMMSFKTMTGVTSRWAPVWPKKQTVQSIFKDHPRAFNTLHYADYDGVTVLDNLLEASNHGGCHLHAMQLDMIWPEPSLIEDFRAVRPNIQVVLQLNKNALALMDDDPQRVVEKLGGYNESVDYALLDKSHGKGLGMDAGALLPFIRAIAEHLPHIGLAVAGGLGPNTMHLVEPVVDEFPDVSIDAQGKLRPSGNAMDPIDWTMADSYLAKTIETFG